MCLSLMIKRGKYQKILAILNRAANFSWKQFKLMTVRYISDNPRNKILKKLFLSK